MAALQAILRRIFDDQSSVRPIILQALGPEPQRVPRVLMPALVVRHLPSLTEVSGRHEVSRADAVRIVDGFRGNWWTEVAALASVVASVSSDALTNLRLRGIAVPSHMRRAVREKATGRVADHVRRTRRLPGSEDLPALVDAVTRASWSARHEPLDEQAFREEMSGPYASASWQRAQPSTRTLRLGQRSHPPLTDSRLRSNLSGTDRDLFSRYRAYYDMRRRSRRAGGERPGADGYDIDLYLQDTDTRQVALAELNRSTRPYGLHKLAHHKVLPVTMAALSPDVRTPGRRREDDDLAGAVDGSEALTLTLATRFSHKFGREDWRARFDLDDLEGYVMRRLWNDLHRRERETENEATKMWFVARFMSALTQYPRDCSDVVVTHDPAAERVRSLRGDDLRSTRLPVRLLQAAATEQDAGLDLAPERLLHLALLALSRADPSLVAEWARSKAEADVDDAVLVVSATCHEAGLGQAATELVATLALRLIRSAGPG